MRPYKYIVIFLAVLTSLTVVSPVLAIPPLPASFYGTVLVNAASVPDGTLIQALIEGQVYAEGYTQTYQGASVYALDVRGDDTDTAARDGGREGDTIVFKIGNLTAAQTGTWHGGTNTNLDLSAISPTPLVTPQPTLTVPPTQTVIITLTPQPTLTLSATQIVKPASPTPSPMGPLGPNPTPFNPGALVPRTQTAAPTSKPGAILSPKTLTPTQAPPTLASGMVTPSAIPPEPEKQQAQSNPSPVGVIILAMVGIVLLVLIGLLFNNKRSKN